MGTVTVYTAARVAAIEQNAIVGGSVVSGNLILTRYSGATLNAGSVVGPTGSPGVTSIELAAAMATAGPIGMICDYIGSAPPSGWLLMTGQTITNGSTTYPLLWAILPASMKSGSNIVFPDTRGRITVALNAGDPDFDTIGEVGGTKTHTIAVANLPSHQHGMSHIHSIDHIHPETDVRVRSDIGSPEGGYKTYPIATSASGPYKGLQVVSSGQYLSVALPAYSGVSSSSNAANTDGGSGTSTPVSNLQPYITFQKMIKAA